MKVPCPLQATVGVSHCWWPSGTQTHLGLAVASLSSRRQSLPEEVDFCLVRQPSSVSDAVILLLLFCPHTEFRCRWTGTPEPFFEGLVCPGKYLHMLEFCKLGHYSYFKVVL